MYCIQLEPENYDLRWSLRSYYSKSNSDEKRQHAIRTTPDVRQFTAVYSDRLLNVFTANEMIDLIRLVPDTYVLRSTVHLGILSFDDLVGRWWVLSFWDEQSAMDCASTLQAHVGVTITDVEKVLSDRACLENSIVRTIMDPTFLHFVADMEDSIVKETQNTFDHDFNYSFNQK